MSTPERPAWDFDYRPAAPPTAHVYAGTDFVVAGTRALTAEKLCALAPSVVDARCIIQRPPLHWFRVTTRAPIAVDEFDREMRAARLPVRYATSAVVESQAWAPPFSSVGARLARPTDWPHREPTSAVEPRSGGSWFLGSGAGGLDVDRGFTGTGAGTRLAVIDDDAAGAHALGLDREVLIDLERAPRAHTHGTLMVAWASGAPRATPPFRGVAPDSSPRLYLIPKPGISVVSLPLAIVRAVDDGADAIVCATYIEGTTSPLLDDAIEFARRFGRAGRGTVVLLPTGRDTSSPPSSVHASLSLSIAEPAADPRVVCIAPGSQRGGWFFYRDRKKRARPFANRGPGVRVLAPGDDIAYALGDHGRLSHAESSGASAVAAGVVLLILAKNPALRVAEIHALLEQTALDVNPVADAAFEPFADPHDTLPAARDADRHNAKHGYGALSAALACMAAVCPIAWALVRIGAVHAARVYTLQMAEVERGTAARTPSHALRAWVLHLVLRDAYLAHAVRAIVRHIRLVARHPSRASAVPAGALARQVTIVLRSCLDASERPSTSIRAEIASWLLHIERNPAIERAWLDLGARVFVAPSEMTV
ncbi:MAG: S8 family serine peptidase [Polyangiaceae bacterium]|nr:S8 family serine peptidase [Polyangiaceae bacterium]